MCMFTENAYPVAYVIQRMIGYVIKPPDIYLPLLKPIQYNNQSNGVEFIIVQM